MTTRKSTFLSLAVITAFAAPGVIAAQTEALPAGKDGAEIIAHEADVTGGVGFRLYEQTATEGDRPPLVLYIGGSEGGFPTNKADVPAALLQSGFSVATLGYFDFAGGPPILSEINLNAVIDQVNALSQRYNGGQSCFGVIGVSKGAEMSLLMATLSDAVDVYVATVPSNVAWQASDVTLKSRSSWIYNESPVTFLRYPLFSKPALNILLGGSDFRALHDAALKNKRAVKKALIPVETIKEPVLLMSAMQDHVWPSYEMSLDIMDRLAEDGVEHRITHVAYNQNHHLFDHRSIIDEAIGYLTAQFSSGEVC